MNEDYKIIESKLIKLSNKFYLNQLIKGIFLVSLFFIFTTTFLLLLEYYLYLNKFQKLIIICSYSILLLSLLFIYCIIPILGLLKIVNRLNRNKINKIIVNQFPEIKDYLLNLFELKDIANNSSITNELVVASIQQKIENLKYFDFTNAVSFKKNRKIGSIFLLSFFAITSFSVFYPSFFKDSSNRLINFNKEFVKPSPFDFILLNKDCKIGNGDDYLVKVKIVTNDKYDNVYIQIGSNQYLMNNDSLNYYSYNLLNINKSLDYYFQIDNYKSKSYTIDVLQRPILSNFTVDVIYPENTGLGSRNFKNITDITINEGSVCRFSFDAFKTDSILISTNDSNFNIGNSEYFEKVFTTSDQIHIGLFNENYSIDDYFSINVDVIPDEYPSITLSQIIDSIDITRIYFKGNILDDYGFNELKFLVKNSDELIFQSNIDILKFLNNQDFYYAFDFKEYRSLNIDLSYFFEIYDNDISNGYKVARSEIFSFSFPKLEEIIAFQDSSYENLESIVNKSKSISDDIKKELEKLKNKLINSDITDWEKNSILKNIQTKKNSLQDLLKQLENENRNIQNFNDSYSEKDDELLRKQEQIEDLLKEIMNDDLKKLLDQFNEMLKDINNEKMNNLSEKLDISLDDLNKQLEKNIELLKKLKIEQQLELISKEIENNIIKQNELIQLNESKGISEFLKEEQKKLKDSFKDLNDNYKKLQELNNELKNSIDLSDLSNEFNKINSEFENSLKSLDENNKRKLKESLSNNRLNMKNLEFVLKQIKDKALAKQNFENLEDLIKILDNLITFSFDQEVLISKINVNQFNSIEDIHQKQLINSFDIVKDSLYSLAEREPSLNTAINKEIVNILQNFKLIEKISKDINSSSSKVYQQNILTSANNLALFMSEVIKQLQQQMANAMSGDQNCQKPGNNPNPNSMGNSLKSMQQSLQNQLEKMMQMMKEGKSGKEYNGELGKALSQQDKMQDLLKKMMNQGTVGSDAYETLKQAEQLLNKVKEDILRNNISSQTISREKQILTRLLEAENAENERDLEEKRKSTTSTKQQISETAKFFDNSISNDNFEERLLKQKLILNRYYQNKYLNYLNVLDSINGEKY